MIFYSSRSCSAIVTVLNFKEIKERESTKSKQIILMEHSRYCSSSKVQFERQFEQISVKKMHMIKCYKIYNFC